MKKNITIKQLSQLNEKGKKKLRDWWKPQKGNIYAYYDGRWNKYREMVAPVNLEPIDTDCSDCIGSDSYIKGKRDFPLLSIGQMIEFLDKYSSTNLSIIFCAMSGVNMNIGAKLFDKPMDRNRLCDALWDECIEVLNK